MHHNYNTSLHYTGSENKENYSENTNIHTDTSSDKPFTKAQFKTALYPLSKKKILAYIIN